MVSFAFIPRFSDLSKNDSYAQAQSSGRNGCWLFSQVGIQTSFVFFLFFFFFYGLVSGVQEEGSECSLTTRNPNLLLEEMLKSDNPADVSSQSPIAMPSKTPRHPSPCRQLHFACGLAQPAVRKEPLNTSPEQRRLEGLWLLSSAGSPFSVFPCSPLPAPFTIPSSSGRFGLVLFF